MILITGAGGKTGQAVVQTLADEGYPIRALVRRFDQIELLRKQGAVEVIVGDMYSLADVTGAAQGVQAFYHICPNVSPDEVQIGEIAIRAAVAAHVERFVYHSVLHTQVESMPHHWRKMRVEEMLFETPLAFTILQPAAYMQNILGSWEKIVGDGFLEVPYSVKAPANIIDLLDVAAAAGIVLTQPGHEYAIYELCGPEPLSQLDIAAVLTQEIGRPVEARQISLETWRERARASGLGDDPINTLIAMFEYYDKHGFRGNSHILEKLIGKPPTDFREFLKRVVTDG